MATPNDVDLLVIGGGCAGLSIARLLARHRCSVRTLVIEPRTDYANDRTWSFWQPALHRYRHLVTHSWDAWRFSTAAGSVIQTGDNTMRYQSIRAIDFYEDAIELIRNAPPIELANGVSAISIEASRAGFTVDTSAGSINARYVIDTRPPLSLIHI